MTALKHMARANVEAMLQILKVRPDALFIQKIIFDRVEGLKPYGEVIGDPAGTSPVQRAADWLNGAFGRK